MKQGMYRTTAAVAAVAAVACGNSTLGGEGSAPTEGTTNAVEWTAEEIREERRRLLSESDDHSFEAPPETSAADCEVTLSARGKDDSDVLNEAVESADSYTVICLSPGQYAMNRSIVVSAASNLTIKGLGTTPSDTRLDFAGHAGDKGFDVTTPGFWIENLEVRNTVGNGVEVKASSEPDNPSVFRKLKVTWDVAADADLNCGDADPRRNHGAYSVYPTRSSHVVVEFCEVDGASDAGLYVGQVEHGIVRHNQVHGNVAGLEVENSQDVVVYDNEVFGNSGGVLALQEPGLTRLTNEQILIRDNRVYANNGCNFANPNTTVANIPSGTGLMSFAGQYVEFRNNEVRDHQTTGLLIVSNVLLDLLSGQTPDYPEGYNPYAHHIFVHGNVFSDNATQPPAGAAGDIAMLTQGFETVTWDGFRPTEGSVEDAQICLGDSPPSFLDITQGRCGMPASEQALGLCVKNNHDRDTTAHACSGSANADGV